MKAKLKHEQITAVPPIIETRIARQRLLETLSELPIETAVRERVTAVNGPIRQAHFSPIAGPADGVMPLDEEQVVSAWKPTNR